MPTITCDAASFRADRPWGARHLASLEGDCTVRLHWTDSAYPMHMNDGPEAFVVLDGVVDMAYRADGSVQTVRLGPGDIFVADEGEEHGATPVGEARILVIERRGSI